MVLPGGLHQRRCHEHGDQEGQGSVLQDGVRQGLVQLGPRSLSQCVHLHDGCRGQTVPQLVDPQQQQQQQLQQQHFYPFFYLFAAHVNYIYLLNL